MKSFVPFLKKGILGFIFLFLFTNYSFSQAKLVEKVEKKDGEFIIPYSKYVLPNGLTILVMEDHSDPLVHVEVTYHVGSAREEIGRSGFAHFFEHMMFQGSDNVADEEHFKIVTEAGGSMNGTTNLDRTNYFETLPNNKLETALWLEADRMGFLLDAVTQKKFEIQRSTVKNERGQRYDNRPYGLIWEKMGELLYPEGHPYSWPTIGYIKDLNEADLSDLKKFFLRWYGPNNAVLAVGGDVTPETLIPLVEKYFGSIPRGPEVNKMAPCPANLEKDKYFTLEDNIQLPQINISYPTVPTFHEDDAALSCLAEILGDGKNSLLYQMLEKESKVLFAYAFQNSSELTGQLMIMTRAIPGVELSEISMIIDEALVKLGEDAITDEAINRFKGVWESRFYGQLESVSGKTSLLSYYETFAGNPSYIKKEIDAYLNVSKEQVLAAYKKYILNQKRVTISTVPKEKPEAAAHIADFEISKNFSPTTIDYSNLEYNKAKDSFDRSIKPGSGQNPTIKLPEYWEETLDNDLKIIGAKNDEIPKVNLLLTIEGGQGMETKFPGKEGIARLTSDLMNESTLKSTSEELNNQLDIIGSSISFFSNRNETSIYLSCLKKHLKTTLALLEEKLMEPAFNDADFQRILTQQIESLEEQKTKPGNISANVFHKLLYGDNHIFSNPVLGTNESLNKLTTTDVKSFYSQMYGPQLSKLVVSGDITKEEIMPHLGFLKTWKKTPAVPPVPVKLQSAPATKIYLIDKKGAAQSEIAMGYLAMPFDATGNYYKATLMNFPLGGAFNSRINLNLREDKGWTYGARSRFGESKNIAPFKVSCGVKKEATDSALVEIVKELKDYADNGISEEELNFLKNSIGQKEALKYETPRSKTRFLSKIVKYNLPADFDTRQKQILNSITKKEINQIAKTYIQPDNMYILVVGDKETILPGLKKLGYEIVELDKEGTPGKG